MLDLLGVDDLGDLKALARMKAEKDLLPNGLSSSLMVMPVPGP